MLGPVTKRSGRVKLAGKIVDDQVSYDLIAQSRMAKHKWYSETCCLIEASFFSVREWMRNSNTIAQGVIELLFTGKDVVPCCWCWIVLSSWWTYQGDRTTKTPTSSLSLSLTHTSPWITKKVYSIVEFSMTPILLVSYPPFLTLLHNYQLSNLKYL